jgi:hypothetical protein
MEGNMNNMTKALKKKFKEALLYFEERYQDIEIRDFDDSVFDRAASLVEDIVYNINRIGYGNPFLKGYYSFEIPFNVEAVEYIL